VLHPRKLAFARAVSLSRNSLDAVFDLTMAYKDYAPGERPSEVSVLKGKPRGVPSCRTFFLKVD
jgi:hypothetical protein